MTANHTVTCNLCQHTTNLDIALGDEAWQPPKHWYEHDQGGHLCPNCLQDIDGWLHPQDVHPGTHLPKINAPRGPVTIPAATPPGHTPGERNTP